MIRFLSKIAIGCWLLALLGILMQPRLGAQAGWRFQPASPTPPNATPTHSPDQVFVTVIIGDNPEIKVRAGPGTEYIQVGTLAAGESAPALGRSAGGDWVQIVYPQGPGGVGWVYSYLVTVSSGLPIVEPPSSPTPRVTPTIDETFAAQFIAEIPPTRKPTFTAPPPLSIPTFTAEAAPVNSGGSLTLYLIIGLAVIGVLGMMLSFIRVR